MSNLRCLVGARVSVLTGPQKVSQLAQLETGARWVAQNDGEVIATFEDLGVSASVPPDERPDLGAWLTDPEKVSRWDALVFSKMDRAFRSTRHCVDLAAWCEKHRKVLVFAEDGLKLDYRDGADKGIDGMMSELFVYLGSFFAQLELNRFQTRAKDMHRTLRPTTRWASGAPPFGYRTVPHPSGKGKGLEVDPEKKRLLHRMGQALLDGSSLRAINRDIAPDSWNTSNVKEALSSPRSMGWKTTNRGRTIVTDETGEPIRMADPIFDNDTWEQIQQALARRSDDRSRVQHSPNPMLGVGLCGKCGATLTQKISNRKLADGTPITHRYYHCSRNPNQCRNTNVRAETLEQLLEEQILEEYGDVAVTEKSWQPGNDQSAELAQVEEQIRRLRAEEETGLVVTKEDHDHWLKRMKAAVDRRTAVLALEPQKAGWVYKETGETFSSLWGAATWVERRDMLSERGVKLEVFSGNPLHWKLTVPDIE